MSTIVNPHDRFFKALFSNQKIAQAFFRVHLPKSVLAKIDLDKLELFRNEHVDSKLRVGFADMVYYSPAVVGRRDYYFYLLIEHQSAPEQLLPLRILRYQVEILGLHIDQHGDKDPLPIVFPIVFYQGQKGYKSYPYSLNILKLFADRQLAALTLARKILLVDLNTLDDKKICKHGLISLLEFTAKHSRTLESADMIKLNQQELLKIYNLKDQSLGNLYLETFINYIVEINKGSNKQKFWQAWEAHPPLKEKAMMTLAERFTKEARQEGKKEGKEEGKEEALEQVARNMLNAGFSLRQIAKATDLPALVIRRLKPKEVSKNGNYGKRMQVLRSGRSR